MRGRRSRVQRIGVGQPLVLGHQLDVLAFDGLGSLDLLHPAAEVLGLASPFPGHGGELSQLGRYLLMAVIRALVRGQQLREVRVR